MIVLEKQETSSANMDANASSMSFEINIPRSDSALRYDIKSLMKREQNDWCTQTAMPRSNATFKIPWKLISNFDTGFKLTKHWLEYFQKFAVFVYTLSLKASP